MLEFFSTPIRQMATLRTRDHRPWPLPRRPWFIGQTWLDLLFAHWPLPPSELEQLLPPPLRLDTFDARREAGDLLFLAGCRESAGGRGRQAPLPASILPRPDVGEAAKSRRGRL